MRVFSSLDNSATLAAPALISTVLNPELLWALSHIDIFSVFGQHNISASSGIFEVCGVVETPSLHLGSLSSKAASKSRALCRHPDEQNRVDLSTS
jgi:hypothetical protein